MSEREELDIQSWKRSGTSIILPFSSVNFLDQRLPLGVIKGEGDAKGEICSPPTPASVGLAENDDERATALGLFCWFLDTENDEDLDTGEFFLSKFFWKAAIRSLDNFLAELKLPVLKGGARPTSWLWIVQYEL